VSDRRNPSLSPFTPSPQELPNGELPLYLSEKSSLSISSPLLSSSCDFSFSDVQGSGDGGHSVDLIKGDNCSKSGEGGLRAFLSELKSLVSALEEEGRLFLTDKEKRALWRVAVQGWKQIKKPSKLLRGLSRSRKRVFCGSNGHLLVGVKEGEVVGFKRANHSCRSVLCPYCQVRESRKRLSQVLKWFIRESERGTALTFITITVPSSHNVFEAVERLTQGFRRLYLYRICGKRNWEKLSAEFFRECRAYYRKLREAGFSREEARRKVEWQVELFRRFEKSIAGYPYEARFKDIFRGVWKFELTYNPETGYHPHFHGITTLFIPKLLLTVLMREVGLGEICDVRLVRGREAIVEIAKYETKYWELEGLSFEERLAVEVCLLGFQKFRNWGVPAVPDEEDDGVQYFALPNVRVRWNEEKGFIERFKELHREQKEGQVSLVVDNQTAISSILETFDMQPRYEFVNVEGVMDKNGEITLSAGAIPLDLLRDWFFDFRDFISTQVKEHWKWERFELKYRPLLEAIRSGDIEGDCLFDF